MAKKDFRKSILEKAKKVREAEQLDSEELTEGEKYILERKKQRNPEEPKLTLGEQLLREREEAGFAEIEAEVEQPEPIIELQPEPEPVIEEPAPVFMQEATNPFDQPEPVVKETAEERIARYLEKVKDGRVEVKKGSLLEQDLQNTPATMSELANLRSVVTRLQTSLTSLGGGGVGEHDVVKLINDNRLALTDSELSVIADLIDTHDSDLTQGQIDSDYNYKFDQSLKTTDDVTFSKVTTPTVTSPSSTNLNLQYGGSTRLRIGSNSMELFETANYNSAVSSFVETNGGADALIHKGYVDANLLDSDNVISVIEETVDSDYVSARVDAQLTLDVLDSAEVQVLLNANFDSAPTIIPADAEQTLGTAARPWKELFVSGSSIYMGDMVLKQDSGDGHFKVVSKTNPDQIMPVDLTENAIQDLNDVLFTTLDSDDFLMWNGSKWINAPIDFSGVTFKRTADLTVDSAPVSPASGDLFINTHTGIVGASWTGIAGDSANELQAAVWSAENARWFLTSGIASASITDINSTTPSLKIDKTNGAEPSLSIVDASADSAGLMSAAHFRKVESGFDSDISALNSALDSDVNALQNDVNDRVLRSGDTMTGNLTLDSASFEVNGGGNITVRDDGDLRIFGGKVSTNKITSVGNSNMSIQRNSTTKILLGDSDTIVYNRLNPRGEIISNVGAFGPAMTVIGRDSSDDPALQIWNSGGISTNYTDFQDDELITKQYADSALAIERDRIDENEDAIESLDDHIDHVLSVGIAKASFVSSRKYHASLYDEDNDVLLTWRDRESPRSWHDDIKYSVLMTDLSQDNPVPRVGSIKTKYKTGGNHEYISLIAPTKYNGSYYLFPQRRTFDGQIAKFDPSLMDSDGEGNELGKGVISEYPNRDMVLSSGECDQVNTVSPLTTDGRYVLVVGATTDTFTTSTPPNNQSLTVLVDLEKTGNDTEYETFTRAYSGSGSGTDNRRAAGKVISSSVGGYSAHIDNGDGTNTVYLIAPGKKIHKAVANDLDNYDVTLETIGDDYFDTLDYDQLITGYTLRDQGGSFTGSAAGIVRVESLTTGDHVSWEPNVIANLEENYILKFVHSGGTTYGRVRGTPWSNAGVDDTHLNMDIISGPALVDNSTITISVHQTAHPVLASAELPLSYISHNGGRVTYKGRISGITVVRNRYILFHALGHGIYSLDTSTHYLSIIKDTSDDKLRYGVMEYDKSRGVPEHNGAFYYIPNSATAPDTSTHPLRVLRVNADLTVDEFPFSVGNFGCDYSMMTGYGIMAMFHRGEKTFFTYDIDNDKFKTHIGDTPVWSGTKYGAGAILTPNSKQSAPNKWNYKTEHFMITGDALDHGVVSATDFLENATIKDMYDMTLENHDYVQTHGNALDTLADGIDDFLNPRVKIVTESDTTVNTHTLDHQYPLFVDDERDPYYHLVPQRFVLLARFSEGTRDKTNLNQNSYSQDSRASAIIMDLVTGKSTNISNEVQLSRGEYPALRGSIPITRADGSLDVYFWVHNPMREVPVNSTTIPLFRIRVPAEGNINDSNPFANFHFGYTNIRMTSGEFTYPSRNPYYKFDNNINNSDRFQYEITPFTIKLRDSKDSGKAHYFFQSGPKQSRDYATHRIMEVFFDETDPDAGSIHPVQFHTPQNEDTAYQGFVSGTYRIKQDDKGVERCFINSNPQGIAELFFVTHSGQRKGKIRLFYDYIPQGTKITSPDKVNKLGHPLIEQRGITNSYNKGDQSAIQWVNKEPLNTNFDPSKERWENYLIYHQYDFGIIAVDLSTIVAKVETLHDEYANKTRLVNNFAGDLDCMHLYNGSVEQYNDYMLEDTAKNLQRFNSQLIDTNANGSVWFFDWKPGYMAFDSDHYTSNADYLHRRGILEVKVDATTDMLQVIGHNTGRKHATTNVENFPHEVGAEGLCKVYGNTFIMSNAPNTSAITAPRFCAFNAQTKTLSLISHTPSESLSLLPVKDLGIVSCTHNGGGTSMHYIDMLTTNTLHTTRTNASLTASIEALTARIESLEDSA